MISLDSVILFSFPAALILHFESNVLRIVSVGLLLGESLNVDLVNMSPLVMMCFLMVAFKLETLDLDDNLVVDPSCLMFRFLAFDSLISMTPSL